MDFEEHCRQELVKKHKFPIRPIAYKEFRQVWLKIAYPLYEDAEKQQKFFFEFLFRLFLTILVNLKPEEIVEVKSIAAAFLDHSLEQIENYINVLVKELPKFSLEEDRISKIYIYIELLSDTYQKYEIENAHTFTEAFEVMPSALNYPPELAFEILSSLGYERDGTVKLMCP